MTVAEKRAAELVRREFALDEQLEAKQAALSETESAAGASLVAGGELDAATRKLTDARAELEVLKQGITSCRAERRRVIRAGFLAESRPLRKRARELRAEADRRQRRLDEMLAELEAFEGVKYMPRVRVPQNQYEAVRILASGFEPEAIGKTAEMKAEAERLEREAAEIESREPDEFSFLVGPDLPSLLAQVDEAGAFAIGPHRGAIRAAFREAERQPDPPRPRKVHHVMVGPAPPQPDYELFYRLREVDGVLVGGKEWREVSRTAAA